MKYKFVIFLASSILYTSSLIHAKDNNEERLPLSYIDPPNTILVHSEMVISNNMSFYHLVYMDRDNHEIQYVNIDLEGNVIDISNGKEMTREVYTPAAKELIQSYLSSTNQDSAKILRLKIGFSVPSIPWEQEREYSGSISFNDLSEVNSSINEEVFNQKSYSEMLDVRQQARKLYSERSLTAIADVRRRIFKELGLSQNQVDDIDDAAQSFTINMSYGQVIALWDGIPNIDAVEVPSAEIDGIHSAMVESGVDPHALSRPNHSGTNIGIWMTETWCPEDGWINNYTLLAGGSGNHARRVASIMRFVSPDSWIYCRAEADANGGPVLPNQTDLAGTTGNPPVHVISRSNGNCQSNGTYDTVARDWDNVSYNNDVPIFLLAGNTTNCNTTGIWSPASGQNVITIGNYNDTTDTIANSSSFVDPETQAIKPELSGPGVNIFIPALGTQSTGTSFSTPHVAAMGANLLEAAPLLRLHAAALKSAMIAAAKRPVAGAFDRIGEGGADYYQFITGNWTQWWNGNNSAFSTFDQNDGSLDGWITFYQHMPSSANEARIVLSWQNEAGYTFANATANQPLGANYDFRYFDPNGTYLGGSYGFSNQYEITSFNPATTGLYKIQIRRTSNGDTDGRLDLGLSINWQ